MVKIITTTKGYKIRVDEEDFKIISGYKWTVAKDKNNLYAVTYFFENKKQKSVRMHRLIMGVLDSRNFIDHKDGDGLNNSRSNLRVCDNSQNMANRVSCKNSSSKFKGVSWSKKSRKWQSTIRKNGKLYSLGYFENEIEAALAYNKAAIEKHGEFAKLNVF